MNRYLLKFNVKNEKKIDRILNNYKSDGFLFKNKEITNTSNVRLLESPKTIQDIVKNLNDVDPKFKVKAAALDKVVQFQRNENKSLKKEEVEDEYQWNLKKIGWDENEIKAIIGKYDKDKPIKIAVIDSGINQHFELKSVNNQICLAPDIAENDTADDYNHGTPVAGIIASLCDNGGINGLFPEVDLINIKVTNKKVIGYWVSAICLGIQYAIDNGADVINISWSYDDVDDNRKKALDPETSIYYFLDDYLKKAIEKGVIVVFSAGNMNKIAKKYLPLNKDIIVVGATDKNNKRWINDENEGSNYGSKITVYAPGVDIVTTSNDGSGFEKLTGTSFAAPQVSALIALMKLIKPDILLNEIKDILTDKTLFTPCKSNIPKDKGLIHFSKMLKATESLILKK